MANHTPLPWGVWEDRVFGGTAIVGSDGARAVGFTKGVGDRDMIVACVNACGAVNPANPAAAAEALPGLLAVSARVALVLRAASINPRILPGVRFDNMANDLRAAIALATGKGA